MQKLLRKNPSASGPLLLCTTPTTPTTPNTFNTNSFCLSLAFKNTTTNKNTTPSVSLFASFSTMPTATTFTGCGSSLSTFFAKKHSLSSSSSSSSSSRFSFTNYCRCSCSLDNRVVTTRTTATPIRAWLLFKEGRVGPRPAWFQTSAVDGSVEGAKISENVEESESESESEGEGEGEGEGEEGEEKSSEVEKPIRLNRRQKASSVLSGNPDLLTIPGVGPRNLRKLVDNGIGGVAELKQLYKDKVKILF